jgi:hypothetical protein
LIRRVTRIDDIFSALFFIQSEVIKMNSGEQAINYIIDTTLFFIKLLKISQIYIEEKKNFYSSVFNSEGSIDYIRWTFLPIQELTNSTPSIINLCVRQHRLCSDYGLANCNSIDKKYTIMQHLQDLDSLIFDEYELRLKSTVNIPEVKEEHETLKIKYDELKTKLIEVYLKQKQIETAVKLAEKYVDFATLVTICDMKSSVDQLALYLDKFSNLKSFAPFVVRYFMDKKKLNFLLNQKFIHRTDIAEFLDNYPYLSWIKDIKNDQFTKASRTLQHLGFNEKDSYKKQKTLLSITKLCLLTNGDNYENKERIADIDRRLKYLSYIETLPSHILKVFKVHLNF